MDVAARRETGAFATTSADSTQSDHLQAAVAVFEAGLQTAPSVELYDRCLPNALHCHETPAHMEGYPAGTGTGKQ